MIRENGICECITLRLVQNFFSTQTSQTDTDGLKIFNL